MKHLTVFSQFFLTEHEKTHTRSNWC